MKKIIRKYRFLNYLLQGILAGVICFCLLGISRWAGSPSQLAHLNWDFEDTTAFCRTVEKIIQEKVEYQQDLQLFEQDGEFDEWKEIDIRQYAAGTEDAANLNLNTTYYLGDLIDFASNGAQSLQNRIDTLQEKGHTDEEIGQILDGENVVPDSLLPLSGTSLSDYARISSNSFTALTDYYRNLCETSLDIGTRYARYQRRLQTQDAGDPTQSPSNVLYYIENTGTKQIYTNLNATSLVAAQTYVKGMESACLLFVGERRFNIMVSDSDELEHENAVQYFMQTRFVGSGEKVLIAVDLHYSAGDQLRTEALQYRQRKPYLVGATVTALICLTVLLVLLSVAVGMAGQENPEQRTLIKKMETVPTEIALGTELILLICWWMIASYFRKWVQPPESLQGYVYLPCCVMVEYWIALNAVLVMVRRGRAGNLWSGSICCNVLLGSRQVLSARKGSQKLMILYAGFVLLNLLFLLIGGAPGMVMTLTLNLAALLYLMQDVVGNRTVREGLQQLSEGKLDYRIHTEVLNGESLEMAKAVNEMGEGLEKAVASMISNERLKSELITNVSHDLKTPLTSIISYADLLKREELHNEKAEEYVRILDSKAKRLKQLTEDLIEVSRINSGNISLQMQPLGLRDFIQQAYGEYEERMEEQDLTVQLCLTQTRPVIIADGAQLWRVFENLLGNIVKYARKGTQVQICLKVTEFTESDKEQGTGSDKERGKKSDKEQVTGSDKEQGTESAKEQILRHPGRAEIHFINVPAVPITDTAQNLQERFVRGDASRRTEGSGLGLSIAGSLTRLMGGEFSLKVEEERFEAVVSFPAEKG